MYDFYFGDLKEIQKDEKGFLLSVKRMMPKWCNSIPDSEFLALADLLDQRGKEVVKEKKKYVIVETGAGASTIAIIYYAMKYDGIAYSWEMNGAKGSLLRTICTETLCNVINKNINAHWKLVAYHSLSPYLGLPILNELVDHVNFFFQDSTHVLNISTEEIKIAQEFLSDGDILAIDDATYNFIHTDSAYINVFRKKLGLKEIKEPDNNICEPFYIETEKLLKNYWNTVEDLSQNYKETCAEDIFWDYYSREIKVRKDIGMEKLTKMKNRFAAWKLSSKKVKSDKQVVSKNDFDGSLNFGLSKFDEQTGRSAYFEDVRKFIKGFLDEKGNFPSDKVVKRSCVVCDSNDFEESFLKDGFLHVICKNCGMFQVSPIPKQDIIEKFYKNPAYDKFVTGVYSSNLQSKMDSIKWNYLLNQINKYMNNKKGSLIEIGCGMGNFLEQAKKTFDVLGFDLNPRALKIARDKGLDVQEIYFEEYAKTSLKKVDVIVMWDVLEHTQSPLKLMKAVKKVLKPGGLFCLIVPNADSFVSRLLKDKTATFGADSSMHLNFFSVNTLSDFLNKNSFEMIHEETIISELRRIKNFLTRTENHKDMVNYGWLNAGFINENLLGHKIFAIAKNN